MRAVNGILNCSRSWRHGLSVGRSECEPMITATSGEGELEYDLGSAFAACPEILSAAWIKGLINFEASLIVCAVTVIWPIFLPIVPAPLL